VTVPGVVFYRIAAGKITVFRRQFDGLALIATGDDRERASGNVTYRAGDLDLIPLCMLTGGHS
jgi:hypothetical protein